jgi:hypothetical protein
MSPITRQDVVDALAAHPAEALRAVLEEARIEAGTEDVPRVLAERIAKALWWHYSTPLGYALDRTTLDQIVDHVANKLRLAGALPEADAWTRLDAMTSHLVEQAGPVALEDLDPKVRSRMMPSWKRTIGFAGGAGGSFGAFAVGRGIVAISRTSIGRILPFIPRIGPWVGRAYRGGALAAAVGGPAGIALSLLAANNALGTNYHRLVPLLLGVGYLGPGAVDAVEVPAGAAPEPA